jgi:hypothetical protein
VFITKEGLRDWVFRALTDNGGRATLVEVCREIWKTHENDLRDSGDLFYTWQYDVRWAATELRKTGIMRESHDSPRGVWELSQR